MELAGTEVPVVWRGRRVNAFVPKLLVERVLALDAKAATRCGAAEASVSQGAEALGEDYAPLARLLLRAEGIASSYIEGVTAPVVDVVLAEHGDGGAQTPAAWVAANLAAADEAIAHASGTHPLGVGELCRWHGALMAGSPTPAHYVGRVREEQGWIGGSTPFEAHLVTPPATTLEGLLADLLAFVNSDSLDPIATAAIAHAQFEIVHPFADGNGRIGRVLISWLLTRRLHLLTPPPVSVRLAADVGGYTAGLTRYRLGETNHWVAWFADAVSGASRAQQELVGDVTRIRRGWEKKLSAYGKVRTLRSDAGARRVLDLLPHHLVLTAPFVASALGLTRQGAGTALRTLADAGVLTSFRPAAPSGRGRPAQRYVSEELLGLAGSSSLRR
ncbi:MAG: Fic family protein [Acidimicrobiales bacterium]